MFCLGLRNAMLEAKKNCFDTVKYSLREKNLLLTKKYVFLMIGEFLNVKKYNSDWVKAFFI